MMKRTVFQNFILTGSGLSAESGIPTFRGTGGYWEGLDVTKVATPEAFDSDPRQVWRFYSMRRRVASAAQPNQGHRDLARLCKNMLDSGQNVLLVSQNVDDLQESAFDEMGLNWARATGEECQEAHSASESKPHVLFIKLHGNLNSSRCTKCKKIYADSNSYLTDDDRLELLQTKPLSLHSSSPRLGSKIGVGAAGVPLSPCCGAALRPDIVWFGEMPYGIDRIRRGVKGCRFFLSVGSSGVVYPAAAFVQMARQAGAKCVNIDPGSPENLGWFDLHMAGSASTEISKLIEDLKSGRL